MNTLAFIKALGGNGGGGGSSLPTDPAQDGTYNLQNTVSSGKGTLSWVSGSSSGGALVVNVTEPETGLYVCDQKAGEILAACKTGIVVFVETSEGEETVSVCTLASLSDGEYLFKPGTANYSYVASSSTDYPTYADLH